MKRNKNKLLAIIILLVFTFTGGAQSLKKADIILNGNIGAPHLFKGVIKLATKSEVFKKNFGNVLEVSDITGLNPISIKGEYAFNEFFGLGFSAAFWTIKFNIKDYYNLQNQGNIIIKDSADVYSFKIVSSSYGIRPNLHTPLKSRHNDIYFGVGLGITKNKLTIGFSSTDVGRLAKTFGKDIELDLSLPGGLYFAPSLGYRHYFGEYVGINFELGYEKGAIVQGGIVFRFNALN